MNKVLEAVSFEKGECIFREGDAGARAYIIESGRVEVSVRRQGRALVLAELGEGELLGEMALLETHSAPHRWQTCANFPALRFWDWWLAIWAPPDF